MAKATVVFSGGSKRMAHNNEDLFERWMMRIGQEVENSKPSVRATDDYVREFVPALDTPTSAQQCQEWRATIKEKERIIVREITLINQATTGSSTKKKRHAERKLVLIEAANECHTQLRRLKLWLHENAPTEHDDFVKMLQMERNSAEQRVDYWFARARAAEAELAVLKSELGVA